MNLEEVLAVYRDQMIGEWIDRLHSGNSERYAQRPRDELLITVSAAYDASCLVLLTNDFSKIDCHIEWITKGRLEGGFSLSEVQNAYELFRIVLLPYLVQELKGIELLRALERLNVCLSYTITRFSNYFQSLQEKQIRDYAQNLERDVEERTKELAESEAKYRVFIEEINDGYFVNQDGIIVFANQAFCDLHGYSLSEVVGRPYEAFIAPESVAEVKRLYETRVTDGRARDLYAYYRLHKDGRKLPTENKVKLITYQGKTAAAGICRDITERTEMERRVRESERLAHIGQLTTSLAHEIRNPLSSVKMNIQILLKNVALNGNDKRRMEITATEIGRLERILAEMLDFARPLRLDPKRTSVNEVIKSCLEIMDAKIREKGIKVLKKYGHGIPFAWMDRDKIEQAIINVLLNSVEVLPVGGEIRIGTKKESRNGGLIRIDIADNGPGIRAEDVPYVFDPFFSNKKKGTGLGLSNTKKIVEAHGGTVSLRLEKPQGLHLCLRLPARKNA